MLRRTLLVACGVLVVCLAQPALAKEGEPLAGSKRLELQGDIAAQMVAGIDRFLLKQLAAAPAGRERRWGPEFDTTGHYIRTIEPFRQRLAHILGVRDERTKFAAPELIATTEQPAKIATGKKFEVFRVRWPTVRGIQAEGLLLVPLDKKFVADIVAIPSAEQTPEQLCGLSEGIAPESQYARRLAQSGCRVLVPAIISRRMQKRSFGGGDRGPNLTDREFVYRPAFEMGRHILGYEVQQVLAGVDWFAREAGNDDPTIGVIGYGDGGQLAMYAAALDQRIDAACVSGYFGPREGVWQEPLDRNVQGLVELYGDAEVASLIVPRALTIDSTPGPNIKLPSEGGGPADYVFPQPAAIQAEIDRLLKISDQVPLKPKGFASRNLAISAESAGQFCETRTLLSFLRQLCGPNGSVDTSEVMPEKNGPLPDVAERQSRLVKQLVDDTQLLLQDSPKVRSEFMRELYAVKDLEVYRGVVGKYRAMFAANAIGYLDELSLTMNPRTRQTYETDKWIGYEVQLDVVDDVFAYGVLLVPKDLKPGEKRPVVVCQHGLEGRPVDTFQGNHYAYHDFAAKLCERGFITFAPQNIYIGKDNFRTLQRKANPLGLTLFSIMVPQHQQICNWLKQLPMVDGERIGFYGLSYGGKSAMRIPPLVPDYCLSICSADFNEWISKNASTRLPFSYVWTGEYEIFEFDLGNTFNYSEMAALIAPRPFMVERGHTDGVSTDEWVAHEYAKVFYHYNHRLKIGDRCEMEIFDGPHTINGKGTFDFLHKHLKWAAK
ncbi:Alpha/beta hydrolase family protein [Anatilimnocola aggregata]|uniref:Alpha/beta hydrolase family protein n=1 Tax=Anatilimnocola aggregata TaxID=2528021 RepID=A0A517YCB9_9BACT|nr:dienelactone hydrolase family protein [Anatilimnocola aggregata]QDU27782.1 Alpha/beta hydrolase family protein [Anatilimnocola aggregata]